MRPYLIVTPPYAAQCAGIRVLHWLCHRLNQRGMEAYTTGGGAPADFLCRPGLPADPRGSVVVYPEIVGGNPLGAANVVRWELAPHAPRPPGPDAVFQYSQAWAAPGDEVLFLTHIEEFFCVDPAVARTEEAVFWAGKGGNLPRQSVTEGLRQITGGWPSPRRELAKLLQQAKVFYSYDNNTALAIEARLCGCPVVMLAESVLRRDSRGEVPTEGVAYLDENPDMEALRLEMGVFHEKWGCLLENTEAQLDRFIQVTQAMDNPTVEKTPGPLPPWIPNL